MRQPIKDAYHRTYAAMPLPTVVSMRVLTEIGWSSGLINGDIIEANVNKVATEVNDPLYNMMNKFAYHGTVLFSADAATSFALVRDCIMAVTVAIAFQMASNPNVTKSLGCPSPTYVINASKLD